MNLNINYRAVVSADWLAAVGRNLHPGILGSILNGPLSSNPYAPNAFIPGLGAALSAIPVSGAVAIGPSGRFPLAIYNQSGYLVPFVVQRARMSLAESFLIQPSTSSINFSSYSWQKPYLEAHPDAPYTGCWLREPYPALGVATDPTLSSIGPAFQTKDDSTIEPNGAVQSRILMSTSRGSGFGVRFEANANLIGQSQVANVGMVVGGWDLGPYMPLDASTATWLDAVTASGTGLPQARVALTYDFMIQVTQSQNPDGSPTGLYLLASGLPTYSGFKWTNDASGSGNIVSSFNTTPIPGNALVINVGGANSANSPVVIGSSVASTAQAINLGGTTNVDWPIGMDFRLTAWRAPFNSSNGLDGTA